MTISDWLNLLGSLGLISVGSIVGSLITIIKHLLDKGRLKTERQSNLQKEIYFKLQEQAGKIFEELNLMCRQVEEMKFWLLEKGTFEPAITNTKITERIQKLSLVQVYFSEDIIQKHNKLAEKFMRIVRIYFDIGKIGGFLSKKFCEEIKKLIPEFKNDASNYIKA